MAILALVAARLVGLWPTTEKATGVAALRSLPATFSELSFEFKSLAGFWASDGVFVSCRWFWFFIVGGEDFNNY